MPKDDLNTTLPSSQTTAGFGAGLIPLHSQLLRESWLVSFPPLSDMLKFSGYSRLIRGQGHKYRLGA